MEQTNYTCKDCALFNDDEPYLPFCMGKDLYTHAGPDDDACGDIIPLVYIRARTASSSRMEFVATLPRSIFLRKRILLAGILSIRK